MVQGPSFITFHKQTDAQPSPRVMAIPEDKSFLFILSVTGVEYSFGHLSSSVHRLGMGRVD